MDFFNLKQIKTKSKKKKLRFFFFKFKEGFRDIIFDIFSSRQLKT